MRRLPMVGLALLALAGGAEWSRADEVLTRVVECTATRNHVVTANPNRIGGLLQNVGTLHVNIGRGTTMVTLHVGARYEMTPNYRGGLDCQTAGGTTAVEVLEEVR